MKVVQIQLPSNKKFGMFFSLLFYLIAVYFLWVGDITLVILPLLVGSLFLVMAIWKAHLLLPLNKLWMKFGLLLGKIISPIVLGLIYFGIFTPISVISRVFGRDELLLRQRNGNSFWVRRDNGGEIHKSFKNQF
jgi:hypothetical protein